MRRLLTIAAAVTLLTACGTGGGTSGDGDDGAAEGDTSTTSAEQDSGGEETLADFFGYGSDDPEEAQARFRDEEARRQELIRACMAEEGFDYTPVMPPDSSFQAFGPGDEEEMARTQGFGITTWYGNEEQFEQDMEWEDPNQEMIESMSDSERDAYYEALHGTEEEQMEGSTTETDPETGEEMTVIEGFGAGCEGEASEEVYGDQSETQELWEELQPEMEALNERIEADPRMVEYNEEWSACMAEAGFEYESRQQMFESIFEEFQQRLDEIVGQGGGGQDPFAGWSQEEIEEFMEENTQEEIEEFVEEAREEAQENIDQEALAELQQEEIDLAVANYECGGDFNEVYQEVSAEYEVDFIDDNREILEQIREAQGGD